MSELSAYRAKKNQKAARAQYEAERKAMVRDCINSIFENSPYRKGAANDRF